MTLFLHGRKIAADATKGRRPSSAAKGTGNLLLHFCHAKISLSLVIGKRDPKVVKQGQHLISPMQEGIEEILRRALLAPSSAPGSRFVGGRRLGGIPGSQDLKIASHPFIAFKGRHPTHLAFSPLGHRLMQVEQEGLHVGSPLLLPLVFYGSTIAQKMSPADAVSTGVGIIARPAVVYPSARKARPDPDLLHRFSSPRGMPGQMSQEAGAVDMEPMKHAIDTDTRLIPMLQGTPGSHLSDAFDRWEQSFSCHLHPSQQSPFADVAIVQLSERLTGASHRKQLPLMQIHRQGGHIGSILHSRLGFLWETASGEVVTRWATDRFDLMLSHHQSADRYVMHLTTLDDDSCPLGKGLLTLRADAGTMALHLIWEFYHLQRVSWMSCLTSRWFPAWPTRTARWATQPIRRWRLVARATGFRHPLFQGLHSLLQLGNQFVSLSQLLLQCLIFCSKLHHFFFWLHALYFTRLLALLQACSRPE